MGGLIYWIVVGLIAGWLAGQVMKGGGYGVVVDIVLGILGGIVGGWVFGVLGFHAGGTIAQIIVAFVGAVILVWIARKLKKAEKSFTRIKNALPRRKESTGATRFCLQVSLVSRARVLVHSQKPFDGRSALVLQAQAR